MDNLAIRDAGPDDEAAIGALVHVSTFLTVKTLS
jgi:hypothetical protein